LIPLLLIVVVDAWVTTVGLASVSTMDVSSISSWRCRREPRENFRPKQANSIILL
jgi:hypothetical protein